jgi:hypothetical protein
MRVDQNECSHELHFPSLWAYEGDVQTLFLEYARTNNLLQAEPSNNPNTQVFRMGAIIKLDFIGEFACPGPQHPPTN